MATQMGPTLRLPNKANFCAVTRSSLSIVTPTMRPPYAKDDHPSMRELAFSAKRSHFQGSCQIIS